MANEAKKNGAPAAAGNAPVAEGKRRPAKASISYRNESGKDTNSAQADTVMVVTEFANGVTRVLDTRELNADIRNCAMAQGFATRIQRSYNIDKTPEAAITSYDEEVADLKNGVWVEGGKPGEPKVTMLAEAVALTLTQAGEVVSDERKREIIEKLKQEKFRDAAKADEHVKMHLADLKRQNAAKAFAEAKANAKTKTVALAGF